MPADLTDRDRVIFYLRELHGWDLDRIGALFGITRERVRQIVSKTNGAMRAAGSQAGFETRPPARSMDAHTLDRTTSN